MGATVRFGAGASHCSGFSCCRARAIEQGGFGSCDMGLAALSGVRHSRTKDQTSFPCIGRRVLYHWTTREVLVLFFSFLYFKKLTYNSQNVEFTI